MKVSFMFYTFLLFSSSINLAQNIIQKKPSALPTIPKSRKARQIILRNYKSLLDELKLTENMVDKIGTETPQKSQKNPVLTQKPQMRLLSESRPSINKNTSEKLSFQKPKERKLPVLLDDLNKLKWNLRRLKKKQIERKVYKELAKTNLFPIYEKQATEKSIIAIEPKKVERGLKESIFSKMQKKIFGNRIIKVQPTYKKTIRRMRFMDEVQKWKNWVKKESVLFKKTPVKISKKLWYSAISGIQKNGNQIVNNYAYPKKKRSNFSQTYRTGNNPFLPKNYSKKTRHEIRRQRFQPRKAVLEPSDLVPKSQILIKTPLPVKLTPSPRILLFKPPRFRLGRFDFQANIQRLEINVKELVTCTSRITTGIDNLEVFKSTYAECYKEFVFTVKLLTQVENWNKKLIYAYIVTKKNLQVYQKLVQTKSKTGEFKPQKVAFAEFYQTVKSHFSEFDFKLYVNKFESKIKLETNFFEQNYEKISQIAEKLDSVQGVYNIRKTLDEFKNEIYAFKSLNSLVDQRSINRQRVSLPKTGVINPYASFIPENTLSSRIISPRPVFELPCFETTQSIHPITKIPFTPIEKSEFVDESIALANKLSLPSSDLVKIQALNLSNPIRIVDSEETNESIEMPSYINMELDQPQTSLFVPPITDTVGTSDFINSLSVPDDLDLPQNILENDSGSSEPSMDDLANQIKELIHTLEIKNSANHVLGEDSCHDQIKIEQRASLDNLLSQTDVLAGIKSDDCEEEDPKLGTNTILSQQNEMAKPDMILDIDSTAPSSLSTEFLNPVPANSENENARHELLELMQVHPIVEIKADGSSQVQMDNIVGDGIDLDKESEVHQDTPDEVSKLLSSLESIDPNGKSFEPSDNGLEDSNSLKFNSLDNEDPQHLTATNPTSENKLFEHLEILEKELSDANNELMGAAGTELPMDLAKSVQEEPIAQMPVGLGPLNPVIAQKRISLFPNKSLRHYAEKKVGQSRIYKSRNLVTLTPVVKSPMKLVQTPVKEFLKKLNHSKKASKIRLVNKKARKDKSQLQKRQHAKFRLDFLKKQNGQTLRTINKQKNRISKQILLNKMRQQKTVQKTLKFNARLISKNNARRQNLIKRKVVLKAKKPVVLAKVFPRKLKEVSDFKNNQKSLKASNSIVIIEDKPIQNQRKIERRLSSRKSRLV